jgi:hypothetical protein
MPLRRRFRTPWEQDRCFEPSRDPLATVGDPSYNGWRSKPRARPRWEAGTARR